MPNTQIVIMPCPLTPAALVGYGILRFLGQISENAHVRLAHSTSTPTDIFSCEGRVCDLRVGKGVLNSQVLKLVSTNYALLRAINFATFGDNEFPHEELKLALGKISATNSHYALTLTSNLISEVVSNKVDLWKSERAIETLTKSIAAPRPHTTLCIPPDKLFFSLPVFQKKKAGSKTEDDVTGSFDVTLKEGRIYSLVDKNIRLIIGGPPDSGKSTFCASLVAEMRNCICSIQSRSSFSDLKLNVEQVTLDLSGRTTDAIAEGWAAEDPIRLKRMRQPWTMRLARKGVEKLLESRAQGNITISDLPGKVDEITRLLAAPADACILLSKDWNLLKDEWAPMMNNLGVPVVSKIRSRQVGEGLSSLVTLYQPGQRLNGRVVALNRVQKSWDPFIRWLAIFLLFDILPTMFGEENNNI